MNIVVLAVMTGVSPIPYARIPVAFDMFDREIEFYGICDVSESAPYTVPIA